jgi:glucoamylase
MNHPTKPRTSFFSAARPALKFLLAGSMTALVACSPSPSEDTDANVAPGAPGKASLWAYSGKTGIGTSYEQYQEGHYTDSAATGPVSRVWFSLAQGIVTETMFGLIHEAQLREMQFFVSGDGFVDEEKKDTISHIEYLHTDDAGRPLSLAYKIVNKDKEGKYEIEKHIFTDPDHNSLVMKVFFRALADNIKPYLYLDPHIANTGSADRAWFDDNTWYAQDGSTALALKTDATVTKSTVGFVGASDGLDAIKSRTDFIAYQDTGKQSGNVALLLQLPTLSHTNAEWQFVLGFGKDPAESKASAQHTLSAGYEHVLANYNGEGAAIGWEDYMQSLPALTQLSSTTTDNGKLLYASALVLKAQEDKTHAGALIASLSNPWGDTKSAEQSKTGYKAVWPRDFYQVAMAMLALGDKETPKVAFEYLHKVQVTKTTPGFTGTPGWFLQKTQVDGQLEWIAIQLDQTAMPVMLGWRLWQEGVLSDDEATRWYHRMLKPAADFLASGGKVKLDWSDIDLTPPYTQQERWEEQSGYSPSTTAAVISGLVSAADLARLADDESSATRYLAAADKYSAMLESTMFTTNGSLQDAPSDGRYYLRITQNTDPNDRAALGTANGQPMPDETDVIDGGFLELVRYGVRPANDPYVLDTLPEIDNMNLPDKLRVKYEFTFPGVEGTFPGWRRYGIDGYGEDITTGLAYGAVNDQMSDDQRGRVWPFFTGERGHYELARAQVEGDIDAASMNTLRNTYVKAMELFANEGLMLPEQVWDGVGNNGGYQYGFGEGTNSATPLAWTHAEYIKLLRSFHDQKVWDRYPLVEERYAQPKD